LDLTTLFQKVRESVDGLEEEIVCLGASADDVARRLKKALLVLRDVDGSTRRRRQTVLRWIDRIANSGGSTSESVYSICAIAAGEHHDPTLSTNPFGTIAGKWDPRVMQLAEQVLEVWHNRNRPKWPTVNTFLEYWGLECPNPRELANEWLASQRLKE
jgi:hypothetical protein